MDKGTVKSINPNSLQREYEYNGIVYKKYTVGFTDGKEYNFSTKKNYNDGFLNFIVNDTIDYEVTNEKLKSAKVLYIDSRTYRDDLIGIKKRTQQQDIQLSVSYNGAIRLAAAGIIEVEEVAEFTKNHFESIFN